MRSHSSDEMHQQQEKRRGDVRFRNELLLRRMRRDYHKVVGSFFKDLDGVEGGTEREELALAVFDRPRDDVKVGDTFEVIPAHSDTTAKLHPCYYGIRNGIVEVVWPNYGQCLF